MFLDEFELFDAKFDKVASVLLKIAFVVGFDVVLILLLLI